MVHAFRAFAREIPLDASPEQPGDRPILRREFPRARNFCLARERTRAGQVGYETWMNKSLLISL